MARPRKIPLNDNTGLPSPIAQPYKRQPRNVVEINPADQVVDKLTEQELESALEPYFVRGMKLKVTDKHWYLTKGSLANSGSLEVPLEAVLHGADYLLAQESYVRLANRRDSKGRRAIGDIIDKAGNDITDGLVN